VYTVTATGRLVEPEEFGEIVVRAQGSSGILRLKDIARIELGALNYDTSNTLDGQPTIGMATYLQPGANALEVADLVRAKMRELRPGFPDIRLSHARALVERGRVQEAATSLDALLAAHPRNLDALLLRGLAGYLQEDLETAGVFWTRAAEAHPAEPRIGIYLSMLARRRMARS
jgi:tetratricopeptide (TPR) repeat protein